MSNQNWTEEELEASVKAYVDMHRKEANGEPFVKKGYYEDLAKTFGRTEKAYEYRMQNISYIYSLMGRRWVSGLKPAKNVGANVAEQLEQLIAKVEGQKFEPIAGFQRKVSKLIEKPTGEKPTGSKKPGTTTSSVTQYNRDPAVTAWVLQEAGGQCESCGGGAPFLREDGTPFLEVHHVRRLADGGPDTIENAIAICPNCHREFHYGSNRDALIDGIYGKINRLGKS
jgi:5-methylcytosine-specific restriction protein A